MKTKKSNKNKMIINKTQEWNCWRKKTYENRDDTTRKDLEIKVFKNSKIKTN